MIQCKEKGINDMNIIDLETPSNTEKYFSPETDNMHPFYITEYGKTYRNIPCYQLRMDSPIGCAQYVISGSGIIICNQNIYTVQEGDTFLLPEKTNQIYYSNPDNQFERIWINFKGELAQTLLDIYNLNDTIVFKNVNTLDIFTEIHEKCKTLNNPTEYKNQTSQLFLKLIQFLADNKQTTTQTTNDIEQIRLYIDFNITENLKISDIAQNFSFSQEHIIRVFKKYYGITPHRYILESKIRLAMIMLKMTDMRIDEISEKLSFSDSHHFSTQFKRLVGYKPSLWRNSPQNAPRRSQNNN